MLNNKEYLKMEYIKHKYSFNRLFTKIFFLLARKCPLLPNRVRTYLFMKGGINFENYKSNFIGSDVLFDDLNPGLISVGENTFITEGCKILSHFVDISFNDFNHHAIGKVSIGKNVFIGLNVIITKPVNIGEGTVIGSGSVITKDIPPYSVVAGNPARILKQRVIIN